MIAEIFVREGAYRSLSHYNSLMGMGGMGHCLWAMRWTGTSNTKAVKVASPFNEQVDFRRAQPRPGVHPWNSPPASPGGWQRHGVADDQLITARVHGDIGGDAGPAGRWGRMEPFRPPEQLLEGWSELSGRLWWLCRAGRTRRCLTGLGGEPGTIGGWPPVGGISWRSQALSKGRQVRKCHSTMAAA